MVESTPVSKTAAEDTGQQRTTGSLPEREDAFPVVLRADEGPALLLRLVVQRLGEGADLGVGEPLGRAVSILALRIVVQHERSKPSTP